MLANAINTKTKTGANYDGYLISTGNQTSTVRTRMKVVYRYSETLLFCTLFFVRGEYPYRQHSKWVTGTPGNTFLILKEADLEMRGMLLFLTPSVGATMYCPGPGVTYCTQIRRE